MRDIVGCLTEAVRVHGPLVRVKIGGRVLTVVAHPEDLRHVLQEQHRRYVRGHTVDRIRPMLGNGLPLSDGDFWLRQRRTMQPAFARPRIAMMVPIMARIAGRYVGALRDGEVLETHHLMMQITREVIVETMFSDSLADTAALDGALADIERHVARYLVLPVDVPLWLPTPDNYRFRRAIETLDRAVFGLIDSRAGSKAEEGPPRDLLDALLQARDPETGAAMSRRELRDEVMNIFFAGHETTANLLTWTTLELSRHPEVAGRVREELDRELGGRAPVAEELPRLVYTNAVLRETLRLHPAAWLFVREAAVDDELRGHRIAQGTAVSIFPYGTHRLPEFWAEPERFDPERFFKDTSLGLGGGKKFSYLPFGAGPHMCIGNHLAMSEALIVLAVLCQRGRLQALDPAGARPRAAATLHVAGGLPARFEVL